MVKKKKNKKSKKSKIPFKILALLLLVIVVSAYLLLSPLSIVNFALFKPEKAYSYPRIPEQLLGAKRRDVTFKSGSGVKLHGIYFEMPGATYTAILNHGQGGNLSSHLGLVKSVLLNGQSVFTYDYEGYGISGGVPSVAGLVDDGESAYDFVVKKLGVKPNKVIQYGASLGTGVASSVSLSRTPAGLVLVCPYTSLRKLACERYPYLNIYPEFLFPQPDIGSVTFIKHNMVVPVQLIHGTQDKLINISHSNELKDLSHFKAQLAVKEDRHHGDFSTNELALLFGQFLTRVDGKEYQTEKLDENGLSVH